jgi:hypothetical protein
MAGPRSRRTPWAGEDARARLLDTYRSGPQIGLVLGAGVTVDSEVPAYLSLALRVFELADEERLLQGCPPHVRTHLTDIAERGAAEPDEIFEYIRTFFAGGPGRFHELVKQALYERIDVRSHKMVATSTYRKNSTLDAVISFCAARPESAHAGPRQSVRVAVNRRVGAILTTNYDNLVEGSFGTKYGKSGLLRPVGRPPAPYRPGTIPVYHCHGYISYAPPRAPGIGVEVSDLLISQHDYFGAFYDQLGFGNVVAANFFRRWPSLFIGSRMTDRNIRRVLYQTRVESIGATRDLEHFAILERSGRPEDDLADAVLTSYGVSVIRIGEFSEISELLRDLYLCPDDVDDEEWNWAKDKRV